MSDAELEERVRTILAKIESEKPRPIGPVSSSEKSGQNNVSKNKATVPENDVIERARLDDLEQAQQSQGNTNPALPKDPGI